MITDNISLHTGSPLPAVIAK